MGKPKRTKEEVKEKRRLAARQRRERIKNDPFLYQQSKEKEKERAYYKRQKEKKKLETIEEEMTVDIEVLDNNITDPLKTLSTPHLNDLSYSLRSKNYTKRVQNCSENPKSKREDNQQDEIFQQSTSFEKELVPLKKIPNFKPTLTTSTPRPSSALSSSSTESMLLLSNNEQSTENKDTSVNITERASSLCSTPTSLSSKRTVEKPIRKKISPLLVLRRHVYKTNKEISYMRKKIEELKRAKEKYRKQALRLQYKNTLHTKSKQSHDKENEPKYVHNNNNKETNVEKIKQDVQIFLEEDENSRICPGKREYISRKTIKKQKRFLTDTLLNLHTKFLQLHTYKISYSTFCKMRPFWVVIPDSRARETCMCKTHTNMDLIIASLKRFDLIDQSSAHKVLSSLCCVSESIECLSRSCIDCANRNIHYKQFDNANPIFYFQWITKQITYTKDGKEKTSIQTVKEKITAKPKEVIEKFEQLLPPYMKHCANNVSKNNYIKHLKQNLPENDCIIHVDFSENYNTKYTNEIQPFHFGGSRKQITMHTSVIHFKKSGLLRTQSFCTLSPSLRHDAVAVWSHLIPVLNFIENEAPHVNVIHFISDSPTGQYRNKKMFYIISQLQWHFPNLRVVAWNYTESGHGKSSADGVGATIKRTADRIVAQGYDIVDIETLSEKLKSNVKGVITDIVQEADILQKDLLIPKEIREYKGTMKVHQVVWSSSKPNILAMRKLSCNAQQCMYQAVECEHGRHHGFYSLNREKAEEAGFSPPSRFILSAPSENKIYNYDTSRSAKKSSDKPKILSNRLVKPAYVFPGSSKSLISQHDMVMNNFEKFEKAESSLNLSDTDSFWAPVSPVDFSLPSFKTMTNVPNNSIKDKKTRCAFFDISDSDESIF
ncbi:unnamed protein product [Euphydryas editha]|uniref:Uncharacterized protein n=1 Tax=Euphydryas editha TaxID=104508 RepID=A0AAU9V1G1_EUPED|nr:unnamed protein product [Euphydryas editha]